MISSKELFSLNDATVAHLLTQSIMSGLPTILLCHMIDTVLPFISPSPCLSSKYKTALGVAGIKSIRSIDDNPVKTPPNQSISFVGVIEDKISVLYCLKLSGKGSCTIIPTHSAS